MNAPIAWGLFNPDTGRLRQSTYQYETHAKQQAARLSNNYIRLIAVPLFLTPNGILGMDDARGLSLLTDDSIAMDGCCPACGACPGFIGAECDETCEWAKQP